MKFIFFACDSVIYLKNKVCRGINSVHNEIQITERGKHGPLDITEMGSGA
jgi:hypothetical protein